MYFYVISSLKDWKVNMWFSFDFVFLIYRISTFPERFIYRVIEFLQPYFTQDTYLMFDCLYDNNAECIDTFTLFQYLQENNIKSYYLINKNNKSFNKIKKLTKLKNVIVTNSENKLPLILLLSLLKVHTVVTSFGFEKTSKFKKFLYKNKRINYIYSDHGIFFMKNFPLNYYTSNRFNYFVVNNELETQMVLENSNWTEDKLIKNGLFRYDKLTKNKKVSQKEIFIMPTWRRYLSDLDFTDTEYFKSLDSLLSNEKLMKYTQENNVKIKIAFHHELVRRINQTDGIQFINKNINILDTTDISEQIPKTSLFITDFSSIAFDFMYLDIPVIFYRFDADLNKKTKEYESIDYAMSKDKYLYNCCYSEEDTVKTIIKYIQNGFILEDENKEKNKQFFTYISKNNICQNFVKIVESINKEKKNIAEEKFAGQSILRKIILTIKFLFGEF